jgi:copper chaperone
MWCIMFTDYLKFIYWKYKMTVKTFEVQNVKCSGCANTLKKALIDEFPDIQIDLQSMPRKITLSIENDQLELLKKKLRSIGYPLVKDQLSTIENINAKAKSFVSCAIGKIDS